MKRSSYRGEHKGSTLKARTKIYGMRVLNIALSVVLVVGLAPSISFAGEQAVESPAAEQPQQPVEQPQAPQEEQQVVQDEQQDPQSEQPQQQAEEQAQQPESNTQGTLTLQGGATSGNENAKGEDQQNDLQTPNRTGSERGQIAISSVPLVTGGQADNGKSEENGESESVKKSGGVISTAAVTVDTIVITPSVAGSAKSFTDGDGVFYANDTVSVAINVTGLEAGDKVTVAGGTTAVEEKTIGAGEDTYSPTTNFQSAIDDSTAIVVTVTPAGDGAQPVEKSQKIVIDRTAPEAPAVSVSPAASDASSNRIYFNLENEGLIVEATSAEDDLFDSTNSSMTANDSNVSWTAASSSQWKAKATINADALVNGGATKDATVSVTLKDKLENSEMYDLVYDSEAESKYKFVKHSETVQPVNLTSESGLLPADNIVSITTEEGTTAGSTGYYNGPVKVTINGNSDILKDPNTLSPTISPEVAGLFGDPDANNGGADVFLDLASYAPSL